MAGKAKPLTIQILVQRCKSCGICIAFCPQDVLAEGESAVPIVNKQEKCSGCKMCEYRCPDLAIAVRGKGETGFVPV